MAEFGENIRKAREEMGITQQTLADKLYVTRQAVSRWENGSRYPDLLTAKALAKSLDTTLDDLLTDDDMRTYPEVNPVIEYPMTKRVQTALFAAAFAINLILTMWYFFYNITDIRAFGIGNESVLRITYFSTYIIIISVLLYGVVKSIKDTVNPKATACIMTAIVSVDFVSNVFFELLTDSPAWFGLLNYALIDILFIVSVLRFYYSKKLYRPILIYVLTGLVAALNLASYIHNLISVIGTADLRKFLTNGTLKLAAVLMIEILFIYMTAVLYRKRKLTKG
ncbi:helix-turn-helix transcriptional regulator [Ruminococcus sp.]|uniref:helix-turn-helix transcriptional regulator n=1 Tax=Ruminococcus sp. TaxID=41978 RepID=UPI0038645DF7